uniref:Uncharacterized protein n=1 Tax=Trichuris muris TaxID=70415 RepID=A0A5S6QIX9_TRIMR
MLREIPWPDINGVPEAGFDAVADHAPATLYKLVVAPDAFLVLTLVATALWVSSSANLASLTLKEQFYFHAALLICILGGISFEEASSSQVPILLSRMVLSPSP